MADTVQQIKDKLSIVDVVSGYIKLERSGSSMRARCPFHAERTPSFHVSPDRGTYHCFGCGVGGDVFTFVEAIEGLDFKKAVFGIWLGKEPADSNLKEGMLGTD